MGKALCRERHHLNGPRRTETISSIKLEVGDGKSVNTHLSLTVMWNTMSGTRSLEVRDWRG